jgi:hypothetical protein
MFCYCLSENLKGGQIMNFTKDMTVAQILRANPNTAEIFMRYGMHCLG